MTPSPFTTYADTVCQSLKNATQRERKAIRQELEDHLTDHAEALIESGWDEAHATQHALDAMGDPNTVGEALNKAFPLRWFVLSRLTLAAFLLCCLPLVTEVPQAIEQLWDYHQAAAQPLAYWADYEAVPDLLPLDGPVQDLPEGGTLLALIGTSNRPDAVSAYITAAPHAPGSETSPSSVLWCETVPLTQRSAGDAFFWLVRDEIMEGTSGVSLLYTITLLNQDGTPLTTLEQEGGIAVTRFID